MISSVELSMDNGVAHLVLSRPDVSNALDLPMAGEFFRLVEVASTDESVRAIALTGAGDRFCVGGDVVAMHAAGAAAKDYVFQLADTMDRALQMLSEAPKPVVVGVQGVIAGAGLALMLAGDVVVSDEDASFVAAYTGIGLTPDCGLSWLLPRAIGQPRALEMVLTNRRLTALEAHQIGLVTRIAERDAAGVARGVAEQFAAGSSVALGRARQLLRGAWGVSRAESGAEEATTIADAADSAEARTLIRAFVGR